MHDLPISDKDVTYKRIKININHKTLTHARSQEKTLLMTIGPISWETYKMFTTHGWNVL